MNARDADPLQLTHNSTQKLSKHSSGISRMRCSENQGAHDYACECGEEGEALNGPEEAKRASWESGAGLRLFGEGEACTIPIGETSVHQS